MQLTVLERILLLNILPDKGDVASLRIIRDLQSALGFDEEESARIDLRNAERGVEWDDREGIVRDIPIGPRATVLITDALVALEKKKQLSMQQLDLYDRFVPAEEPRLRAVE